MKIAHLSDIHFFRYNLSLKNFFSKELLGTLNHFANRSQLKNGCNLIQLPFFLKEKGVTHVVITGDFTTTSNIKEYTAAKEFIDHLEHQGFKIFFVPGNHDKYTQKSAQSNAFYKYLKAPKEMQEKGFVYEEFGEGYHWIGLDTTLATPLLSSQGLFSCDLEKRLISLLDSIDKTQPLIVVNHFPVRSRKAMPKRHQMIRYPCLKQILEKYPNIKLYLFGHTHLSEIFLGRPILLNGGSLTLTKGGSFHLLELQKNQITIEGYSHQSGQWEASSWQQAEIH